MIRRPAALATSLAVLAGGCGDDRPDPIGEWTVVSHRFPGISAMSEAEAASRHHTVPADSFLSADFGIPRAGLGPPDSIPSRLELTEVACAGREWTVMGGRHVLLHDVMPVAFLLYWWIAVPAGRLPWTDAFIWMLYPLLYFVVALLSGALSAQYPYPFIHAGELGYHRVLLNATGILLSFVAVGLLLIAVGRRKKHPRTGRPT